MSVLLEFAFVLIGPILSLCVFMLVAVVWRKVLASERETSRRLSVLEERILRLDRPVSVPATPKAMQEGSSQATPRRVHPPQPIVPHPKPHASLISVPNLAISSDAQLPPESDLNRRFASVWDLAEAGASSEAIARKTGHPVGQVELILGLKRQSETTNGGLRLSGPP